MPSFGFFFFFFPTEKPIKDSYLTSQRLDKMRYKNWKMIQVSSVLVTNPFLLNILTLLVPKTTLYNTLAKSFIFTMATYLSILLVFLPRLCINFHNFSVIWMLSCIWRRTLNILLSGNWKIQQIYYMLKCLYKQGLYCNTWESK